MDLFEFKREQQRLATKVQLEDGFSTVKKVGGAACVVVGKNLLACVVVCELPSFTVVDKSFCCMIHCRFKWVFLRIGRCRR